MTLPALMGLVSMLLLSAMTLAHAADPPKSPAPAKHPSVIMKTSLGEITIELYPDKAPITVKNFLDYVNAGYYDGTIFHRVIFDFMIQGGGLTADVQEKREGQKAPIKNESGNGLKNGVGTIAMARTSEPDSATSQFFINVKDNDFLNHKSTAPAEFGYAVFGQVIEGMNVVHSIEKVKTGNRGMHQDVPAQAVVINSVKLD